jgi:23S rRNA U2552 (ribose-2'-O)-methylase RlmE/FtsJ
MDNMSNLNCEYNVKDNLNCEYISPDISSKLNELKTNISQCITWSRNVKLTNKYEIVPQFDSKRRISRAFYKFKELNNRTNVIPRNGNIRVLCICEAPGGFIEAILDIAEKYTTSVSIRTQSFNKTKIVFSNLIEYDCIDFGPTGDGNIIVVENQLDLIKKNKGVKLVTADGGIDVSDNYSMQEYTNSDLIRSEIVVGLYSLCIGGNFVIKTFDLHLKCSVQMIYLLFQSFDKVEIVKPKLSRPCNSEKYIICTVFNGRAPKELFNVHIDNISIIIPESFEEYITQLNNELGLQQIKQLTNTLSFNRFTNPRTDLKNIQYRESKKLFNDIN